MAAPANMTGYANNAKWTMNHKLSDGSDDILAAQGVGFLKRKAIGMATVGVSNTTYTEGDHLVVKSQSSASGIPGAVEEVHLDGSEKHSDHAIYGKIVTVANLKKKEEISDSFMTADLLPESGDEQGRLIYIESHSDKAAGNKYDWTAVVTSGFMNIDVGGKVEKRWVRCKSHGLFAGLQECSFRSSKLLQGQQGLLEEDPSRLRLCFSPIDCISSFESRRQACPLSVSSNVHFKGFMARALYQLVLLCCACLRSVTMRELPWTVAKSCSYCLLDPHLA